MTLIKKEGGFAAYYVPEQLYHGTTSLRQERIAEQGLRPDLPRKESALSREAVYLTTNLALAASVARNRAFRHGGEPIVLAISAESLDPDRMNFDWNMCGLHWSESIAYDGVIDPEAIRTESGDWLQMEEAKMRLDDPTPGDTTVVLDARWPGIGDYLAACASDEVSEHGFHP